MYCIGSTSGVGGVLCRYGLKTKGGPASHFTGSSCGFLYDMELTRGNFRSKATLQACVISMKSRNSRFVKYLIVTVFFYSRFTRPQVIHTPQAIQIYLKSLTPYPVAPIIDVAH